MIQSIKKCRCLVVGLEHTQARGRSFSSAKLQRGNNKTFFAELNFFWPRTSRSGMQATLPIQFRFLLGAQSRLDNSITVVEGYLARGDASYLGSHFVVDFVT